MDRGLYGRIARTTKQAGAKIIVDTSGSPLKAALEAGVYIVKPSLREFRQLTLAPLESERDRIGSLSQPHRERTSRDGCTNAGRSRGAFGGP